MWAVGVGLVWALTAALLAISYSGRIRDWSVMTDELQYVKLAISVADTHSPLPMIHGTSVALAIRCIRFCWHPSTRPSDRRTRFGPPTY